MPVILILCEIIDHKLYKGVPAKILDPLTFFIESCNIGYFENKIHQAVGNAMFFN